MESFDQWMNLHQIEWRKTNVAIHGTWTMARSAISVDPARGFVGRRSLARHRLGIGQLAAGIS